MRQASPSALVVLLACVVPGALAGCDSGGGDDDPADDHADAAGDTHADEATDDHGETSDEASDCDAEDRDDDFAIGLSKSGALVQATFVSADPAPPIKDDNTWTLDFADLAGEPLDDLEIVVVPMMPDHSHGTPVEATVTATGEPGRYTLSPVNLFMAGYWEVTLDLTLAGGESDSVMFGFCVE